jgi:uncharacterized protein
MAVHSIMNNHLLITGATGLIGRAVCGALLRRGDRITALTRNPQTARSALPDEVQLVRWQGVEADDLRPCIDGIDGVIHLAATSVGAQRWTPAFKQQIRDSRVGSTRALAEAIAASERKPRVFLSMSGIGYYGDRGEDIVDERSGPGSDFLAQVCVEWEARALQAASCTRVVIPRTAIVLASEGGALSRLLLPFKLFAGGPMGNGTQYFPWIHIDDLVAFIVGSIDEDRVEGAYNLCAPEAVRNRAFCASLARRLGRPSWLPVPAPLLRLAIGEFAETLLGGQHAVPARLLDAGFPFLHPDLDEALESLLG